MNERSRGAREPMPRSWVPDGDADFPLANLPYGAIVRAGDPIPHLAVAIGDFALDLHALARAGIFDDALLDARALLCGPTLDALLACGRPTWSAVRAAIGAYLHVDDGVGNARVRDGELAARALVPRGAFRNVRPFTVATYVDFFASLEHATNLGRILRPGEEPLAPNWRHLPVGYHGRASTLSWDDTVRRPRGIVAGLDGGPIFVPTRKLDYELELACVTGDAPAALDPDRARASIFGFMLLNDWSARDIQAFEYRPLGPFLGKSFATSLSPWIVPFDALESYRCAAPEQSPQPLAHLRETGDGAYDIDLEVAIASAAMRARGDAEHVVARTNARGLYWTMGQQLAHVTSNGTRVRAGDVYATGTISGVASEASGSLIERTWDGARPLALSDGTTRTYLEDGDHVVMRAVASRDGRARIGFGALRTTVARATAES